MSGEIPEDKIQLLKEAQDDIQTLLEQCKVNARQIDAMNTAMREVQATATEMSKTNNLIAQKALAILQSYLMTFVHNA
jgi:hypothetical protein